MTKCSLIAVVSLYFIMQTLWAQDRRPYTGVKKDNVTVGGGYFAPSSGNGGAYFYGGYYYEVSPGLFIGANLEYSSSTSTVFGVDGVRTTSVNFPMQIKYLFSVNGFDPYIGAALGYGTKILNEGDIESKRPGIDITNSTAQGFIVAGLAGFMGRISETVHAVAELRYSGEWVRTKLESNEDLNSVGGVYVSLGLQLAL